jgi:hypothetical protein
MPGLHNRSFVIRVVRISLEISLTFALRTGLNSVFPSIYAQRNFRTRPSGSQSSKKLWGISQGVEKILSRLRHDLPLRQLQFLRTEYERLVSWSV